MRAGDVNTASSRRRAALRTLLAVPAALALVPVRALAAPDWKMVVEPQPKIQANYPAGMRVRITDANGRPVSGATVEYVVTMRDMDHGEHKSPAPMTAPGVYEGKVNFFMVGPWTLEVRARRGNDALSHRQDFDIAS